MSIAEDSSSPRIGPPRPFIPAAVTLPELTLLPLVTGTVLGIVFGASSLYLVLKVGLTVSASIPVAVIAIAMFRLLSAFGLRQRSILENNIVQTAGSAGESIAFGIGVTMPAILILGFDLEITRVMLVSVLGGMLGILMMIPLRRAMIVEQHAELKFPEGTACAEVLKAAATAEEHRIAALGGATGLAPLAGPAPAAAASIAAAPASIGAAQASIAAGTGGRTILTAFGIGLLYKTLNVALKLWKDVPERIFKAPFEAGSVAAEISPELLGVGYIIGPRIAAIMCGGGVLAYLVLIPAIKFFGQSGGVLPPGTVPIATMDPDQIRAAYVLYIGAGAVAAGGVISLVRSLPTIWQGLAGGLADLRRQRAAAGAGGPSGAGGAGGRLRTDDDLSLKVVAGGVVALIAMIMIASSLHMNLLGALLIVLFGFLFVTVSSRLTGEIGSSSNPISGMTVATLLLTCLIFLQLHWTGPTYYVTALSVGAIVCIAASNGGTISQDLKTGFLVGSTPRHQEVTILIASTASALALGPVLLALNDSATVYVPRLTFERVAAAAAPAPAVPPAALAALPLFSDSLRPPVAPAVAAALPTGARAPAGAWRLLNLAAGAPGSPAGAAAPAAGDQPVSPDSRGSSASPGLAGFPGTVAPPGSSASPSLPASPSAPGPADSPGSPGGAPEVSGLEPGDYLIDSGGHAVWRVQHNFPAGLRARLQEMGQEEALKGPQARQDPARYRVWQKPDDAGGPQGRYLVDASGAVVYLVDPGINGTHEVRPDGTRVVKFAAPKATLMSYIIKGILNRQLPWALVLLGVMISLVLEMAGISSLAFAVGVYLPLSSTSPIWIGGLVRWLVDHHLRRKLAHHRLSEEELAAEGDRSPGVLMASGYIAGGAIAGIVIAFTAGVLSSFDERLNDLMTRYNPFFGGPRSDALSLLPFAVLVLVLYLAGREAILATRQTPPAAAPPEREVR